MIRPIKYSIYKGVNSKYGCVQFSIMKPHLVCLKCKSKTFTGNISNCSGKCDGQIETREGAVFIDVANAVGPNVYDWDKKTIFALSVVDMGKIVSGLRLGDAVKLLHDPGAQSEKAGQVTKTLNFTAPTNKGSLFSIQEKVKGSEEIKNFSVPLSPDEVTVIGTLLSTAISVCLSWN